MNRCRFENGLILRSKAPRQSKRGSSNTKVATKKKNATEAKLRPFSEFGNDWLEITMPIITVSEANGGAKISHIHNGKKCYKSEHWSDKHRRHRLQKGTVALLLRPHRNRLVMPCKIILTRYAPDHLDRFDNLPMSLKWILDSVCEVITNDYRPGRADANEGIADVKYAQVQSQEYGVKVRIENITCFTTSKTGLGPV